MTIQYLLDTNVISELMRNPAGKAAQRLAEIGDAGIAISIVTAAELRYGAAKKGSRKLTEKVEAILSRVPIIALEIPADAKYGEIRFALEKTGKPIGPNDLLIAAHAKALGGTLVTANLSEFKRVEDLNVENWIE
ncbi:ribonuclease VapC [Camelimonas fluminis]|uniref:Ribonuclease VapC n=1 Tax=Camelimonas fluminis TaxID=1576911 RepID=A0ABV7UG11_9HYPH|nr:type II toxin-antitoxin system VapC family toxin [Camelimonas fluminis]GHE62454.1 ribonuclease VapC [Camelimonas fluminis]